MQRSGSFTTNGLGSAFFRRRSVQQFVVDDVPSSRLTDLTALFDSNFCDWDPLAKGTVDLFVLRDVILSIPDLQTRFTRKLLAKVSASLAAIGKSNELNKEDFSNLMAMLILPVESQAVPLMSSIQKAFVERSLANIEVKKTRAVLQLFQNWDIDGNGFIDADEFAELHKVISSSPIFITNKPVRRHSLRWKSRVRQLKEEGSPGLTFAEFQAFIAEVLQGLSDEAFYNAVTQFHTVIDSGIIDSRTPQPEPSSPLICVSFHLGFEDDTLIQDQDVSPNGGASPPEEVPNTKCGSQEIQCENTAVPKLNPRTSSYFTQSLELQEHEAEVQTAVRLVRLAQREEQQRDEQRKLLHEVRHVWSEEQTCNKETPPRPPSVMSIPSRPSSAQSYRLSPYPPPPTTTFTVRAPSIARHPHFTPVPPAKNKRQSCFAQKRSLPQPHPPFQGPKAIIPRQMPMTKDPAHSSLYLLLTSGQLLTDDLLQEEFDRAGGSTGTISVATFMRLHDELDHFGLEAAAPTEIQRLLDRLSVDGQLSFPEFCILVLRLAQR
eukprot:TRINITY_DN10524_c0_g1_i1.p1 TRINITY_DN10524_c0_g1~~TRINITY_DN10524_c0_g1_i1.p1  ORF type:complete len:547 (+),score=65.61 TRINITY_DN10524_c0_g1_i1:36-1676(+)